MTSRECFKHTYNEEQIPNLHIKKKKKKDGINQQLHYKEIYRNCKERLAIVNQLAYLTV